MLTPEQLAELRRQIHYAKPVSNVLAVTTAKLEGLFDHIDAQAQQLNAQRIMIEAQLAVKGRIRDEASKRGSDASSAVSELGYLIELIDAQQARIAEADANNTALLYLLAQIREACGDNGNRMPDELVAYIGELAKDAGSLRIFAAKVAQQTAEKPDHWNSCGQCERNASEAEDLIEVAPSVWPEDTSDYGSRIDVIWQNGATGEHYEEDSKQ